MQSYKPDCTAFPFHYSLIYSHQLHSYHERYTYMRSEYAHNPVLSNMPTDKFPYVVAYLKQATKRSLGTWHSKRFSGTQRSTDKKIKIATLYSPQTFCHYHHNLIRDIPSPLQKCEAILCITLDYTY